MSTNEIENYVLINQRNIAEGSAKALKTKLSTLKEEKKEDVYNYNHKDPTAVFISSVILGIFGVDRFMLGKVPSGVAKFILGLLFVGLSIPNYTISFAKTFIGLKVAEVTPQTQAIFLILQIIFGAVFLSFYFYDVCTAYKRAQKFNTEKLALIMAGQYEKKPFNIYDFAVVGLMAAVVFVTTYFFKIEIPTPTGTTMLKVANVFCILSGLLFGGLRGGLASGIGSFLFDLTNPRFIASAPTTLLNFFLMAYICGVIANHNTTKITVNADYSVKVEKKDTSILRTIVAATIGSVSYTFLYFVKSVINLMLAGSVFSAAAVAVMPKMVASGINAVIAIVFASLIAPSLKKALKKANIKVIR